MSCSLLPVGVSNDSVSLLLHAFCKSQKKENVVIWYDYKRANGSLQSFFATYKNTTCEIICDETQKVYNTSHKWVVDILVRHKITDRVSCKKGLRIQDDLSITMYENKFNETELKDMKVRL